MPLFSWMKWSNEAEERVKDEGLPRTKPPGVASGHMLLRELLWHVEERERLARHLERERWLAHRALGLRRCHGYPRLRTMIPASELLQLECLCAQVPPIHATAVLSRFRDVLATEHILPWELVCVFKQVLSDFLCKEGLEAKEHSGPRQGKPRPTEEAQTRFIAPIVPKGNEQPKEEIPTISGYVDRAMRRSGSGAVYRDYWDLPHHCPISRATEGYSTAI